MNNPDMLIDNLIRNTERKDPPVVVAPAEPTAPEQVPPEVTAPPVIAANDAEGRQPGDPDAPIEIPAEALTQGPRTFKMLASDELPTEESIVAANPVMPPMPKLSEVMAQPVEASPTPVISERTRLEMGLGKSIVDAVAATQPARPAEPQVDNNIALSFAPKAEAAPPAPVRYISEQTRAELEAGRMAIERRRADAEFGRAVAAEAALKRVVENAPPGLEDLSYAAPKGS